jgi:hypothetical protein
VSRKHVPDEVQDWVPLAPVEIYARSLPGHVPKVKQQGRDPVRSGRRLGSKYAVTADFHTIDMKHISEVGCIPHVNFQEQHGFAGEQVKVATLIRFVGRIVGREWKFRIVS